MNPETTPVTMITPYGPLHIAVANAERYSYHDSERGDVTDLRPFLRVATDPTFEADPGHAEHWTIRGRAYALHHTVFFEDRTKIEYANGYEGERWHRDRAPYAGGFRKDNGGEVPFGTATWDLMWKAVVDALDTFAEQYPGWEVLSRFLLLRSDAGRAAYKAEQARREAAQLDAEVDALSREAAGFSLKVPDRVMDLYNAKEN